MSRLTSCWAHYSDPPQDSPAEVRIRAMADIPPPPPGQPSPPPQYQPPPYQAPPTYQQPPGSPGYMPPPIAPTSGLNLGAQIRGAGYSIGVGVIGILVPVVTALFFGGSIFYFYV